MVHCPASATLPNRGSLRPHRIRSAPAMAPPTGLVKRLSSIHNPSLPPHPGRVHKSPAMDRALGSIPSLFDGGSSPNDSLQEKSLSYYQAERECGAATVVDRHPHKKQ